MEEKNSFERLKENRKELVDQIIEIMGKGELHFMQRWDAAAISPVNASSNTHYRGGNRLRLMYVAAKNNYTDPRWMTYKQAQNQGYQVRKGSKGVACEKWLFTKKEPILDPNGNKVLDADGKTKYREVKLDKPYPMGFVVFNGSQIDGLPEFRTKAMTQDDTYKTAEYFLDSAECPIKEIAQDRAYYSPLQDEIVLPLREAFNDYESFLSTAIHEMVHSTGHASRLNRGLEVPADMEGYAREELIAELGTVFTKADLGIKLNGEHFESHAAYLQSWIKALQNDPNELFRIADQASKASERLIENYRTLVKDQENTQSREQSPVSPDRQDATLVYIKPKYSPEAIAMIKGVGGHRYNSSLKLWSVPQAALKGADPKLADMPMFENMSDFFNKKEMNTETKRGLLSDRTENHLQAR